MILEEIVSVFAHLCSSVVTHSPPIAQDNRGGEYSFINEQNEDEIPEDVIHREYEQVDTTTEEHVDGSTDATTIGRILVQSTQHSGRTICTSFVRSLQANAGLLLGVFVLGLFTISLVYVDLNTSDSCVVWKHSKHSVPPMLKKIQTAESCVATIPLYTWFPVSIALLWGIKEFKRNYLPCLYIALVAASITLTLKVITDHDEYETNLIYR